MREKFGLELGQYMRVLARISTHTLSRSSSAAEITTESDPMSATLPPCRCRVAVGLPGGDSSASIACNVLLGRRRMRDERL